MFKINIYKSQNSFSFELKLSEEYKEIIKNIKKKKYDAITGKWIIPLEHFDYYLSNVKKLTSDSMINIMESDSDDSEDDDQFQKKQKIEHKCVEVFYKENMIMIPLDSPKEVTQTISLFKDYNVDLEKMMWQIPIKHKFKLFENFSIRNIIIKENF